MFIGFVALNQSLYDKLQESGFILQFKPTIPDVDGKIKGNIENSVLACLPTLLLKRSSM